MITDPPLPAASIDGTAATHVFQTPVRLTSITSCHACSDSSMAGAKLKIPALATTMSSRPSSATAFSVDVRSAARSRTSTTSATIRRPVASTAATVSSRSAGVGQGVAGRGDVVAEVEGDDVGALLGQPHGVAAALSACGAGDQCHAPVDPSHSCSFRGVTESGQPQTSLATETTSSSLRHWSSMVSSLP